MTAREMALALGLAPSLTYSVKQTARYTGIGYHAVLAACKRGTLRAYLPEGGQRGYRIRPEWVDEWLSGSAAAAG